MATFAPKAMRIPPRTGRLENPNREEYIAATGRLGGFASRELTTHPPPPYVRIPMGPSVDPVFPKIQERAESQRSMELSKSRGADPLPRH